MGEVFPAASEVQRRIQNIAAKFDPPILIPKDMHTGRIMSEILWVQNEFPFPSTRSGMKKTSQNTRLTALGLSTTDMDHRVFYGCLLYEIVVQLGWETETHFTKTAEEFQDDYFEIEASPEYLWSCTVTRILIHFIEPKNNKEWIRKAVGLICNKSSKVGKKISKSTGRKKIFPLQKFVGVEGKCPPEPRPNRLSSTVAQPAGAPDRGAAIRDTQHFAAAASTAGDCSRDAPEISLSMVPAATAKASKRTRVPAACAGAAAAKCARIAENSAEPIDAPASAPIACAFSTSSSDDGRVSAILSALPAVLGPARAHTIVSTPAEESPADPDDCDIAGLIDIDLRELMLPASLPISPRTEQRHQDQGLRDVVDSGDSDSLSCGGLSVFSDEEDCASLLNLLFRWDEEWDWTAQGL